jgi:hypothetical protein
MEAFDSENEALVAPEDLARYKARRRPYDPEDDSYFYDEYELEPPE